MLPAAEIMVGPANGHGSDIDDGECGDRTYFRNSADAVRRTAVAGADAMALADILAAQAEELARRGRPVDATPTDLLP